MSLLAGPPTRIAPKIYHLRFNDQERMAQTLLRFQEYYENPKFRGKIFTLAEFKEYYKKTHDGQFTYYQDWEGFNFPSSALQPFHDNLFKVVTPEEWFVMALTYSFRKPFYLISTPADAEPSTLRHEAAHGLYATDLDYKAEVLAILEGVQLAPIIRYLMPNYHYSVFLDECHAYLLADFEYLRNEVGLKINDLQETSDALNSAFNNYIPNLSEIY